MTKTTKNNASATVGLTVHVSERALAAMATAGIVLDLRHEDEMSPDRHQPITVQQGQPMETPQAWITEGMITTDLQGSMIYQGQGTGQETKTEALHRQIGEDANALGAMYCRNRNLPGMLSWERERLAECFQAAIDMLEEQQERLSGQIEEEARIQAVKASYQVVTKTTDAGQQYAAGVAPATDKPNQ